MQRIKTTVVYKIPRSVYCNHKIEKHKNFPVDKRCRFCTNVGKGLFVCVLHNEPLDVREDALILKCDGCIKHVKVLNDVPDENPTDTLVEPKSIIKWALAEYTKRRKELIKQGYPELLAEKIAKEMLVK